MSVAQWNALDWLLVAVLLFSVLAGFRRGLVRTVLGLAGYVCGFMLASWKYMQAGDVINGFGWIRSPATARVLAYLLIVALVVIVVELVARITHQTVRAVGLGFFDRLLGTAFGFLRGCIAAMALLMIPAAIAPRSKPLTTSVLAPYFLAVAHDVSFLLPRYLGHMSFGTTSSTKKYTQWMDEAEVFYSKNSGNYG